MTTSALPSLALVRTMYPAASMLLQTSPTPLAVAWDTSLSNPAPAGKLRGTSAFHAHQKGLPWCSPGSSPSFSGLLAPVSHRAPPIMLEPTQAMPLEMLPAALDTHFATCAVARSRLLSPGPTRTGSSVASPACHRLLALAIAPLAHVALTYRSKEQTLISGQVPIQ